LDHGKIVNPYDRTIAPIKKGTSNGPTQFGKKPGLMAEMATGFILGYKTPDEFAKNLTIQPADTRRTSHPN
jgi:hypothetical protein